MEGELVSGLGGGIAAADTHEVSKAALPRAARIRQGVAAEAERRGDEVMVPRRTNQFSGRRGADSTEGGGEVVISVDGHPCAVKVSEEGLPSRSQWEQRNGSYRYGRNGVGPRRSDREGWTVEGKLPDLLQEVEVRSIEA